MKANAQNLHDEIIRLTQKEVFSIARKVLTDLSGANLEERITKTFISRLNGIDGEVKSDLDDALKSASDPVIVRTAFDLSDEQRTDIQHAINSTFASDVPIRFETKPDVISGIELATNGQKLAWSIAAYLSSLEKGLNELLVGKQTPLAEAKPKQDKTQPEKNQV